MRIFPNAKVVLTIRDPESWYESVKATIFQTRAFLAGPVGTFLKMVGGFRVMNLANNCANQEHHSNAQGITAFRVFYLLVINAFIIPEIAVILFTLIIFTCFLFRDV